MEEAVKMNDKDLQSTVKRLMINLTKLDPTNQVDSVSYYKLAKTLNDNLTELLNRK